MRATSTWLFCQRGGVRAARPHRRRGGCSIQGVRFVRGQAVAASERFAGGVAPLQRSGTATGRARAGPNRVLCAPAAGYDARRVMHLAGGRGRPEREPGHAVERVRALRAASFEAVQAEVVTCFKFVDEASTNMACRRRYARAEGDARGRPDLGRPASGHDRERGRQRRSICRISGLSARPHARAQRRDRAR